MRTLLDDRTETLIIRKFKNIHSVA